MRVGAAVAFLLLADVSAGASPELTEALITLEGTISVESAPSFSKGKLRGCTLLYDTIVRDWTYRQGQFLKVSGSVGFMATGQNQGAVLKVVVHEIAISGSEPSYTPSPPSRAYLVDRDFSTNLDTLVQAAESETPGALFSIFQLEPSFGMVVTALKANELGIAFNSGSGDTDVQMKIDLDVIDVADDGRRIRSETQKADFIQCILKLIDR